MTGANNTLLGASSGASITSGTLNAVVGSLAAANSNITSVAILGYQGDRFLYDGSTNASSSNSLYLGTNTKSGVASATNENVIGNLGIGNGSNTNVIGNTSTTQTNLYGDIQTPILAPSAPTLAGSSSGGSIGAGTYFYRLTANDGNGNTSFYGTQSSSVTTTGSTSSVTITFPALPVGAVSWNIYRTTTTLVYGASTLVASAQTGASYVDVSAATTTGTPATVTTGFSTKFSSVSAASSFINNGGNLGIGTNAPSAKAVLDLTSTTKGLLLPRMTKTQRDAISSPPAGLAIYQTDNTPGLRVYNGTNWMKYTETAD